MEAPADPPRFKCPPDFSASLFCPEPPFSQETLQDPSKELWLIRAPASFIPESLDGHSVPLLGSRTLQASQPDGPGKRFHIQSALEHLSGSHLLLPAGHGDHLCCSPPFSGSLSICERYGDPSNNQPLFPVAARPAPQLPGGLKQRFLPCGNHPGRPPLSGAAEEPPRKKRKKKTHRPGEEGSECQRPVPGTPLRDATGAGAAEPGCQHRGDGAARRAADSQPSAAASAPNGVLSGEPEDSAPSSMKKKKKKKRKEDREPAEEARGEAEAGHQPESGAALLAADSQPSSAASAQDGLFSGEAEELGPRSQKKKKKRKDTRDVKEETGEEAEATGQQKEDGAASWAVGSPPEAPPSSAAFAHQGPLSGEAEAPGPGSKKKKKKRKEDREPTEERKGEAEATSPHQVDGAMPWPVGFQPAPAVVAQDGLLFGEAEHPAPSGKKKKKKKRKEDREQLKEEMGGEAAAARLPEEDGAALWEMGSQPNSEPAAWDIPLSGEAGDLAPRSKKKKKKKKGQEVEEETGVAAEGLLGMSSWLGGGSEPHAGEDSLPGVEEVAHGTHAGGNEGKAAPPEPFSSQEDAAGMWGDFSGPGPTPEGGLVVAEEQLGVGSSSHKAKKKRKKEKEKPEEAAQEVEGRPALKGVDSGADLGTPLEGGGGGQEAEPGMEELGQKRKKEEARHRL